MEVRNELKTNITTVRNNNLISDKGGGMSETSEGGGMSGNDGVVTAGEGMLPWTRVSICCTEGRAEAVVPWGVDGACDSSLALDPRVIAMIPKCCLHTPVDSVVVSTGRLNKGSATLFRTPGINFQTTWKRDRNSCQRA